MFNMIDIMLAIMASGILFATCVLVKAIVNLVHNFSYKTNCNADKWR